MNNFVQSVEGQLDSERLHDVFKILAVELRKFIGMLASKSLEEAKKSEIAGFVRMQIRLNEVQELYAEFETFKSRCLSIQVEHLKWRTENIFNQEDAAILMER